MPINQEASSSTSSHYIDPSSLAKLSITLIHDVGSGEYDIESLFFIGNFSASLKTYGKLFPIKKELKIAIFNPPTTFTKWGELNKETIGEDISMWIYKDEEEIKPTKIPVEQYSKGFKIMNQYGYDGHSGLGLKKME